MFLPLAAFGHHSFFGRFDTETFIEIEGEVVSMSWRNPHIHIGLDVITEDGERVSWDIEGGSPSQLQRAGIIRDAVRIGDRIRVAGYAPLTENKEIIATNILTASGQELVTGSNIASRWPAERVGDRSFQNATEGDSSRPELGLFRVWSYTSVSPFLFPDSVEADFDLDSYPLTASAREALQTFDRATDNPTRSCVPKGMPLIMEQPYPMEFVKDGDDILLRIEEYDTLRVVHMDAETAPAGTPDGVLGYSVGRWDGRDLVVTTTHLSWPWFNQLGIPQSTQAVLVERFSPTDDGSRLDYMLTVTDPVNFTEPVTLERYWLYLPDQRVLPYDCEARD